MSRDQVSFCHTFKRIDAQTVAEALMEVFSNTGISAELLHDQGQVFMSKITTTLCGLLNIKQLKTTAYHPQTNSILERWHGCLKNMLRKQEKGPREWDRLLKYCLLAYRATLMLLHFSHLMSLLMVGNLEGHCRP